MGRRSSLARALQNVVDTDMFTYLKFPDGIEVSFTDPPRVTKNIGTAEANVEALELGNGVVHKTVLTLSDFSIPMTDGNENDNVGGAKVYTFPEGAILILGATAHVTATATGNGLGEDFDGDFGVGTAVVAGTGLDDAEVGIIPKTEVPQADGKTAVAKGQSTGTQIAVKDGTSSAVSVYLNFSVDAADSDGNDTLSVDGTITIAWMNLGDY